MSGTRSGTPAPTEVVNYKLMVPKPGWFNGDRKMFED